MERKWFILVIIFIIVVVGISLLFTFNILTDNDDEIDIENDDNTFIVGIDTESAPFTYKDDNGEYKGFDLDLAREVCDRNGWKLVIKPIVWNEMEDEINSGKVDCIWTSFTINGRENQYTWSDAYFSNKQVVIVKSDSGINSLSDLSDKVVEVLEGSSSETVLNTDLVNLTNSFFMLVSMMDYRQDFDDLESGVADAIVMDYNTGYYMVNKYGPDKYKILDEEICSEQFGVGFKKGNTDLRDKVQKTLDEMFEDGTVKKIAEQYKDYGIPESVIYPKY